MASSANPYDNHYNSPHVEDDDLIDPDDGKLPSLPIHQISANKQQLISTTSTTPSNPNPHPLAPL